MKKTVASALMYFSKFDLLTIAQPSYFIVSFMLIIVSSKYIDIFWSKFYFLGIIKLWGLLGLTVILLALVAQLYYS